MARRTFIRLVCVGVLIGLATLDAAAWGPKAQQAISQTAIQVVRRSYSSAFAAPEEKYDADVIRGTLAGPTALRDIVGVNTDAKAIHRITTEVQLLREAKKFSAGSYFSYRMGVLSSLVADMFLPYSMDTSPDGSRLARRVEQEIDKRVEKLAYRPERLDPIFVRDMSEYFAQNRSYYDDARIMIATDFDGGKGYDGYLANGTQNAFQKAVQAVADVWYTVLYTEPAPSDVKPSKESLSWYVVDAIEYQLTVRKNLSEAEKAYGYFAKLNPNMYDAYERIGDMFYEYGQYERGVREWQLALMARGPERQRVVRKIANHYIEEGKKLVASASERDASETALQEALDAFDKALQIDRGNEQAVQLIFETKTLQAERNEREQTDIQFVSAAKSTYNQATEAATRKDYAGAIALFNKAESLYANVSDEFKQQREAAQAGINDSKSGTRDVTNKILEEARDVMEEADRMIEEAKSEEDFDNAKNKYSHAQQLTTYIPETAGTAMMKQRDEVAELAKGKAENTDTEKKRWKEAEDRRKRLEQERKDAEAAAAAARNAGGGSN